MEYDLVRKVTNTIVGGVTMLEHIELADDGGAWSLSTYSAAVLKIENVDVNLIGAVDTGICPFCQGQTDVYEFYYPRNIQTPVFYHICHQCAAGVFEHEMPQAYQTKSCSQGSCTTCSPSPTCPSNRPTVPIASTTACSRCGHDNWETREIPDFWNSKKTIQVKKCRNCGNCP